MISISHNIHFLPSIQYKIKWYILQYSIDYLEVLLKEMSLKKVMEYYTTSIMPFIVWFV